MRRRPTRLRTLAWNAHAGDPRQARRVTRHLSRWVQAHKPDRIVLNEVGGARPQLAAWAKRHGYRLHQERRVAWRGGPKPEQGSTAVLTRRKTTRVKRRLVVMMKIIWRVMSTGTVKAPRQMERVILQVRDDKKWRTIRTQADHWPTGEGKGVNEKAWREARDRAYRFLDAKVPALVDGDLNADRTQAAQLAREVGGHYAGRIVDWCVTNGPRVQMTVLDKGGADHFAVVYDVEF